ncbi:MAG: L-histidine N(alpha)-methyltransferase [Burkholderiales bacterium]|nr:L-histidine N(alpha)-methyltransferase [Burkholderiales bacterium]
MNVLTATKASGRVRVSDLQPEQANFAEEVAAGLRQPQKTIPPKFFYDARGSQLFEAICETPEYYPTRTESAILQQRAGEVSELVGAGVQLIEIGSGNSQKVRLLLDALKPASYMPLDISRDHLVHAADAMSRDYPWLDVHAVCVDYMQPTFALLPRSALRKLAFFPGSTIGNFEPHEALAFLRRLRGLVAPGGAVLIGVDLKKDAGILNRAYNDASGVTARFNLNLLARINRELGADFDLAHFEHDAFYNEGIGRIEMHLVSTRVQNVCVGGERYSFERGETIHTENSYKYSVAQFQVLGEAAGFNEVRTWTDVNQLFSLHYLAGPEPE